MRHIKLTRKEKEIEEALIAGHYADVGKKEFEQIAQALADRRKDAVLNIRVNSRDLQTLKEKARKLGIRYQTFISEILHRVAEN